MSFFSVDDFYRSAVSGSGAVPWTAFGDSDFALVSDPDGVITDIGASGLTLDLTKSRTFPSNAGRYAIPMPSMSEGDLIQYRIRGLSFSDYDADARPYLGFVGYRNGTPNDDVNYAATYAKPTTREPQLIEDMNLLGVIPERVDPHYATMGHNDPDTLLVQYRYSQVVTIGGEAYTFDAAGNVISAVMLDRVGPASDPFDRVGLLAGNSAVATGTVVVTWDAIEYRVLENVTSA